MAAAASSWMLSSELVPGHHGGVHAVAVLNDDFVVSGADDHTVCVWRRVGRDFACVHIATEHKGQLRAIVSVPACPALPTGGFATACLDKLVRIYAVECAATSVTVRLVRELAGHSMGVISLSWTATGELISGGWEGVARVWDIATGACKHTLEGHENGTCVLGLPTGEIVVGSTGRKEGNSHVDYKIRIWRFDTTPGVPPAYTIQRVIEDHDQAVRGLALLREGAGFVSVGNDGAVKVRNLRGDVQYTFMTSISPSEGKPFSVFGVGVLPDGRVVSCNEDQSLRVFSLDTGRAEDISLPGVPWAVDGFSNSDLVVACNQAGTSARGHAYVWTRDSTRAADDMQRATFAKDMEPPKRAEASEGGGSDEIKVSGPYEHRNGFAGAHDGQYGFFRKDDGSIMVCAWSVAAGAWTDIGVMEEGPTGGASGGGDAASNDAEAGTKYDYVRGVTMETPSGMRSLQLRFNENDDPSTVAHKFIDDHGLGIDNYEQVRDFILAEKQKAGGLKRAAVEVRRYKHFPTQMYLDLATVDWAKLLAKLRELNGTVAANGDAAVAALALSKAEEDAVQAVADVLAQTSRYHASSVNRAGVTALHRKALAWPAAQAFPAIDMLRILVIHPDGSEAVAEVMGGAFVAKLLARIAESKAKPELRAVTLLSARTLFNAMKHEPTRRLIQAKLSDVLDATSDLLNHDHATVKFAATVLVHNLAHFFLNLHKASSAPGSATGASAAAAQLPTSDMEQLIALILQNIAGVKEEEPVLKLLIALGTLCVLGAEYARMAQSLECDSVFDELLAAFPSSTSIKEAIVELRGAIASAAGAAAPGGAAAAVARH